MDVRQTIDYMISCLKIAKDELDYAYKFKEEVEKEKKKKNKTEDRWYYTDYERNHRIPNGTLIRENIKMVGRMAFITAKRVVLSRFVNEIEK